MIGIKFGSYDLQSGGVVVEETDIYDAPQNDIQADELAERDGALIVKQRYTSKRFTIKGHIQKDTVSALESARDAFLTAMSIKNQSFDVDYAGGVRRYLASMSNVAMSRVTPTTFQFNAEFLSPDGMGWDLNSTQLLAPTAVTTSTASNAITVGGSYQAEPLITVTVSAVTGGTTKTITISNGVSLRGISITRTWSAGDVLEIDCLKRTVYVNDVATDFRGQFLVFASGAGSLDYLDDFTTRSVAITSSYTRRWL